MRYAALICACLLVLLSFSWLSSLDPALAQSDTVPMDLDARAFSLSLGEGAAAPDDWTGEVSVRGGRVLGSQGWQVETEPGGRPADRIRPITPATVGFSISGGRRADVRTAQGEFSFVPGEIAWDGSAAFLDGRAVLRRAPLTASVAAGSRDEDFPACSVASDGTVWCVYVAYDRGSPVDMDAVSRGDFESLRPTDNGDRIHLLRFHDGVWRAMGAVTEAGLDVWRPTIALASGRGFIAWSEQRNGQWDLFARPLDPADGSLGETLRVTQTPGADFNVALATDSEGRFWAAWQGRKEGGFDIWLQELGGDGGPQRVSTSAANDWNPSIAAGPDGAVWIAWDTYDKGDYDVYVRRASGGRLDAPIAVAASARFEARASVAIDSRGRPWVAFEDAAENWGKDYGDRWPGRQAVPFYQNRYIVVRTIAGDRVLETKARFESAAAETYRDDPKKPTVMEHRVSMPRLAFDSAGRLWLAFRQHPLRTGLGEIWASYAAFYEADRWSEPIGVPGSTGLIDNRPALVSAGGGLMAVFSTDKRETAVQNAKDADLRAAFFREERPPSPAALREVDPLGHTRPMIPIHPEEAKDISRLREERLRVGDKEYRILRGEFHRHTEISSHRDWDGPMEEVWRYGLDVADMDWIGTGDHDYGRHHDYLWWLTQKQTDLYNSPGSFLAMHTYERSQGYPSGHRNVMFARRGIRALPRLPGREAQFGSYEDGSADIRNLYAYLRAFGGICSSHTSATNMGTDWRDADAEVEPVVEIYQGHRQSYEEPNAPLAASGPAETIQGFRPLGFVWEAFKRGRKLGFQASSDHVSTHISYGMAWVEGATREGVIAAFKRRHSYAANDNILLDVRSGEHLMGDELTVSEPPRLDVRVVGTTPVDRVDIVRQEQGGSPSYVATFEPRMQEVRFSWTDNAAREAATHMYYVRVQQRNGAMAWASPLWVTYREN